MKCQQGNRLTLSFGTINVNLLLVKSQAGACGDELTVDPPTISIRAIAIQVQIQVNDNDRLVTFNSPVTVNVDFEVSRKTAAKQMTKMNHIFHPGHCRGKGRLARSDSNRLPQIITSQE